MAALKKKFFYYTYENFARPKFCVYTTDFIYQFFDTLNYDKIIWLANMRFKYNWKKKEGKSIFSRLRRRSQIQIIVWNIWLLVFIFWTKQFFFSLYLAWN